MAETEKRKRERERKQHVLMHLSEHRWFVSQKDLQLTPSVHTHTHTYTRTTHTFYPSMYVQEAPTGWESLRVCVLRISVANQQIHVI